MTYHRGADGQPAKLTCEHYDITATAPGIENIEKKPCPAEVTGRPTAAALRTLARELGWRNTPQLGDRCPKHIVVGTHASRLARRGRR